MTKPRTQWQWQPDWRLWLLAFVLFPVLVGLGFWQVDRAQEKTAEREQWESEEGPRDWPVEEPLQGQPVLLEGHYDEQARWFLDNRTRDGRRGYELLQLFHPDSSSEPVVVNRGWIEAPASRSELPEHEMPDSAVTIEGRVAAWPDPMRLGESDPADRRGWPRRVAGLTPEELAEEGMDVAPAMVRLVDEQQAGALQVDWEPGRMDAATHRGYALQWFALSVVLVTLTIAASFRKVDESRDDE